MKRANDLRRRVADSFFPVAQVFSAAITFLSTFFRTRASMGFELLALKSQLAVCQHRIQERKDPRPTFNPAFRFLWVILSKVWSGWRRGARVMQADTVTRWHQRMFKLWWRWRSRRKGGRPPISREMQLIIRRLSKGRGSDHRSGRYDWHVDLESTGA